MEHAKKTIDDLEKRLTDLESEARKIKIAINCLCEVSGQPIRYQQIEKKRQAVGIQSDRYYGKPLATAITEVLTMRKSLGGGAITLDEIYEDLMASSCDSIKGKNDNIKKRNLAISMSKNPKFHKVPNGTWGLSLWYPNVKGILPEDNQEKHQKPRKKRRKPKKTKTKKESLSPEKAQEQAESTESEKE